ncbi:hypothetical protein GEMRC1_002295 [Eukaryota sp. GEM-RC1]
MSSELDVHYIINYVEQWDDFVNALKEVTSCFELYTSVYVRQKIPEIASFLTASSAYQAFMNTNINFFIEVEVLDDEIQVKILDTEHSRTFTIHIHKPDLTEVQQSLDPLISYPYGSTDIMVAFTKEVAALLHNSKLMKRYHSPVLSVVNSTGLGKSRLLLEYTNNSTNTSDLRCRYASFPRYSSSAKKEMPSVPPSSHAVLQFFTRCTSLATSPLHLREQRIELVVRNIQCLVVALLLADDVPKNLQSSSVSDWQGFHNKWVQKAEDLYNAVKGIQKLQDFTDLLIQELLSGVQKGTKRFVACLDEVGTLLSYDGVDHFLNSGDIVTLNDIGVHPWNLYRCLRYAARNLHIRLNVKKCRLLVVVAGTHSGLQSLVHDPVTVLSYILLPSSKFNVLQLQSAKTIHPFVNVYQQLDIRALLSHDSSVDFYENYISPLLSYRNALSRRPCWLSIAKPLISESGLSNDFFVAVDHKIDFCLTEHAEGEGEYSLLEACVLTLCFFGSSLQSPIISHLIKFSFPVLQQSIVSHGLHQFCSFSVDPILTSSLWKRVVSLTIFDLDRIISDLIGLMLGSGLDVNLLGERLELIVFTIFNSIMRKCITSPTDTTVSNLEFCSLYDVFSKKWDRNDLVPPCSSYVFQYCPKFEAKAGTGKVDLREWYVSILQPVTLRTLNVTRIKDGQPHVIERMLLFGLVYRVAFQMPRANPSFDFLVPIVKRQERGFPSVADVCTAISNNRGGDYLGILKIQIKTGQTTLSDLKDCCDELIKSYTQMSLLVTLTKRIDIVLPETPLVDKYKSGWVLNLKDLVPNSATALYEWKKVEQISNVNFHVYVDKDKQYCWSQDEKVEGDCTSDETTSST